MSGNEGPYSRQRAPATEISKKGKGRGMAHAKGAGTDKGNGIGKGTSEGPHGPAAAAADIAAAEHVNALEATAALQAREAARLDLASAIAARVRASAALVIAEAADMAAGVTRYYDTLISAEREAMAAQQLAELASDDQDAVASELNLPPLAYDTDTMLNLQRASRPRHPVHFAELNLQHALYDGHKGISKGSGI